MLHASSAFLAPLSLLPTKQQVNLNHINPRLKSKNTSTCPRRRGCNQSSHRHVVPYARSRRGRKPEPVIPDTLYDAKPQPDIDYQPFDFGILRDKVVLVVNVASADQFAESNYQMFVELLESYHAGGLEILAYPSNWYGQYETGSQEEIKKFVHSKYSDKIKLMAKSDLEWNSVFALGQKYFPGEVIWNFHGKFLFGRKGLPVARFDLLSTRESIESQVSLYVNNTDPKLHDNRPPEPCQNDDDEIMFFSPEAKESMGIIDEEEDLTITNDSDDNSDDDEREESKIDQAVEDAEPEPEPEVEADLDADSEPVADTVADVDANAAADAEEEDEREQNQ